MKGQSGGMERPSMDTTGSGTGLPSPSGNLSSTWDVEDRYWADNFNTRPYAKSYYYERFRPAYRYGVEGAQHHLGRSWEQAEPDLRAGWDRYEHRGEERSTWDEVRDAVKDAWDRMLGRHDEFDEAKEIGDAFERGKRPG